MSDAYYTVVPDVRHLIAFELEQSYLIGGSPRRSFKDAKIQRVENMAGDIAVGVAVLAVAKKDDILRQRAQR